jgi:hypothetical protein
LLIIFRFLAIGGKLDSFLACLKHVQFCRTSLNFLDSRYLPKTWLILTNRKIIPPTQKYLKERVRTLYYFLQKTALIVVTFEPVVRFGWSLLINCKLLIWLSACFSLNFRKWQMSGWGCLEVTRKGIPRYFPQK